MAMLPYAARPEWADERRTAEKTTALNTSEAIKSMKKWVLVLERTVALAP
jgi:hypothetical protein